MRLHGYYMTQRPPAPGAMPKGAVDIIYMDSDGRRVYVNEIGCEAYALLRYSRELTEKEICDYELICGGESVYEVM